MFKKILWLTGMPRSGTNWLSQIIFSHPDVRLKFCPLFSYEFKNARNEDSTTDEWRDLFKKVYETESEYMDQEYLRRDGHVPSFSARNNNPSVLAIKSTRFHNLTQGLLEKCPEIMWIAIVRNPYACIHSWLSNNLEFPAGAAPMAEWRNGKCRKTGPGEFWGFEDWKAVTNMFLDFESKYPGRFRIIRYESLVKSALEEALLLFNWLNLNFSQQTKDFLVESQNIHSSHKRSVYKLPQNSNDWQCDLNPEILSAIKADLENTPLNRFTE